MANPEEKKPEGLEKPAGAEMPKEDLIIHVIPEKFYGAGLKAKVNKVAPKPEDKGKKDDKAPAPPAEKAQGGKKGVIVAVVIAAVVLLGGGGAAFFFMQGDGGGKEVASAPVCGNAICESGETSSSCKEDCGPALPTCGNGMCEEGESSDSCASDCGAPAPICGDNECTEGETSLNCEADCGPPPTVCGNNKCEEGETEMSCLADCKPAEPTAGPDADSDGLTDEEEKIYGTNSLLTNTDRDSYVDLNEVLNLFDPNEKIAQSLEMNPGITVHNDTVLGYQIYRPTRWTIGVGEEGSTAFKAPSSESVEVLVDDIAPHDNLIDWYKEFAPDATLPTEESLTSRRGHEFVFSPSNMTAFVRAGERVFIISYELGDSMEINFRVTFEMMVNSFKVSE